MDKHDIKAFVQCIQNKVSIAVAIAVIRTKPSHLTAKEYAEEIQKSYLKNWLKRNPPSAFDGKILEQQKRKIWNQVTDLLPPAPSSGFNHNSDLGTDIPDVCSSFVWDDACATVTESDSDSDGSSHVKNNIKFIDAMIQLKFAVESSKTLSVNQVHSFLPGRSGNLWLDEKPGSQVALSRQQCSEDSGFGDSGPILSKEDRTVPCSILRFRTHSVNTDALLEKCISSLLLQVRFWLHTQSKEKYHQWKESVLEHLTSIFRTVSDNLHCTSALADFIMIYLDEIWDSDNIGELEIWEYQMTILSEFCCNTYITEAAINLIVNKIEVLSTKLSSDDVYCVSKLNELFLIEKTPIFLNMFSRLLKKWDELREKNGDTELKKVKTITAATVFWNESAGQGMDSKTPEDSLEYIKIGKWKIAVEKLIRSSSQNFPLVSLQAWEIMEVLDSI